MRCLMCKTEHNPNHHHQQWRSVDDGAVCSGCWLEYLKARQARELAERTGRQWRVKHDGDNQGGGSNLYGPES